LFPGYPPHPPLGDMGVEDRQWEPGSKGVEKSKEVEIERKGRGILVVVL